MQGYMSDIPSDDNHNNNNNDIDNNNKDDANNEQEWIYGNIKSINNYYT